jgi:cytochrome oxidase Cu insertion factor (SCO1/SenC/PrrC family)
MPERAPVPHEPAPPLSGTLASGAPFDLATLRGRKVLIEFHRGTW